MLSALKQGDFNKVYEYVDYQELLENAELDSQNAENQDKEKLLFEKLEWNINKINVWPRPIGSEPSANNRANNWCYYNN